MRAHLVAVKLQKLEITVSFLVDSVCLVFRRYVSEIAAILLSHLEQVSGRLITALFNNNLQVYSWWQVHGPIAYVHMTSYMRKVMCVA
jgi:hypothetical protein